jgi:hypothetical protein
VEIFTGASSDPNEIKGRINVKFKFQDNLNDFIGISQNWWFLEEVEWSYETPINTMSVLGMIFENSLVKRP